MSPDPDVEPLLAGLNARLRELAGELRALVSARWQLARLEAAEAWKQFRRLAIALAASFCVVLIALGVLLVAAGDALGGTWGWPRWAWLLGGGVLLLLLAAGAAGLAWQRFRRGFVGLTESLEEVHEDLVWLREHWPGR